MSRALPRSLFCCLLLLASVAYGQTDFSYMSSNGSHGWGGGVALDFGYHLPRGNLAVLEPGSEFFATRGKYVDIYPILAGFRYSFHPRGGGFYLTPLAGYTFGSTTLPVLDAYGNPELDPKGNTIVMPGHGFTAGLGFGYRIPGLLGYSPELRYEHVFVPDGRSIDMIGFHVIFAIAFPLRRIGCPTCTYWDW